MNFPPLYETVPCLRCGQQFDVTALMSPHTEPMKRQNAMVTLVNQVLDHFLARHLAHMIMKENAIPPYHHTRYSMN